MSVLVHHFENRVDAEGHLALTVVFDLTVAQAQAAAHAVRVVREVRYRTAEMSSDDVLAMRDMTALADELTDVASRGGTDHVHATVARLGALRSALEEFAAGDHLEREGDADARPMVFALADSIGELHAEAVRTALDGPGVVA